MSLIDIAVIALHNFFYLWISMTSWESIVVFHCLLCGFIFSYSSKAGYHPRQEPDLLCYLTHSWGEIDPCLSQKHLCNSEIYIYIYKFIFFWKLYTQTHTCISDITKIAQKLICMVINLAAVIFVRCLEVKACMKFWDTSLFYFKSSD